jgi:chromosome segregation ATPase
MMIKEIEEWLAVLVPRLGLYNNRYYQITEKEKADIEYLLGLVGDVAFYKDRMLALGKANADLQRQLASAETRLSERDKELEEKDRRLRQWQNPAIIQIFEMFAKDSTLLHQAIKINDDQRAEINTLQRQISEREKDLEDARAEYRNLAYRCGILEEENESLKNQLNAAKGEKDEG